MENAMSRSTRSAMLQAVENTQKAMMAEHICKLEEENDGLREELALMTARWAAVKSEKEEFENSVRTVGSMVHERTVAMMEREERARAARKAEYRRGHWWTKLAMRLEDVCDEILVSIDAHFNETDRAEKIVGVLLLVPMLCLVFFAAGRWGFPFGF